MKWKSTTIAAVGALAVGTGAGYAGGAVASEPAAVQAPPAKAQPSANPMMDGTGGSMMTEMMDAEHAKMMRDPAMRRMHRTMVREHAKMMRDPAMRRQHERAMREFPEMARMMRKHMES